VATRATAVPDPLPVAGARVAYAEVETALGHAVASAAVPWATGRPIDAEPLRLLVELTDARAEQRGDRLAVAFAARGTLRRRRDLGYLAQAVVHCRQAALVPPDRGAEVIDACLVQLGRDLAGWLGAVVR